MAELIKPYLFDWRRIFTQDNYHIEYSITDICNRNCKSCSHLAPLALTPNFVTKEEFEKVVGIMQQLIPDAHTFWLTGGEPTLHPGIFELLEILRTTYCNSYVGIYSNGITLKKWERDKSFWAFMREKGIVWAITNYDMPKEYFENLFKENGCSNNLTIIQSGNIFAKLINYSKGQVVSKDKYLKCGWERSKLNIRNGRLYNCPSSEFADLFNARFGRHLTLDEKDYLIIDEKLKREDVDSFRGPIPFCSQCDISMRRNIFINEPSRYDKSEWSSF